ncbi:hypothetical protein BDW75DRAFT_224842 [Aspergillus navahoensis]
MHFLQFRSEQGRGLSTAGMYLYWLHCRLFFIVSSVPSLLIHDLAWSFVLMRR